MTQQIARMILMTKATVYCERNEWRSLSSIRIFSCAFYLYTRSIVRPKMSAKFARTRKIMLTFLANLA